MMLKLGVLVSGTGTNLQSIIDAIDAGRLRASIKIVISNKSNALALRRAENAGIETAVISHKDFSTREDFDRKLVEILGDKDINYIVLAGFMRVLTPVFLDAFPQRVINIHPALLPSFPGVDAQAQAVEYGVKVAGCTVHFVDAGTDTGPIISQAVVPVHDNDTRDALAARILTCEHELLVDVLRWLRDNRVHIISEPGKRRRVVVDDRPAPIGVNSGNKFLQRTFR